MNLTERHIKTDAHVRDPQSGDLYQEMFSAWLLVVDTSDDYVWLLLNPERDTEQRLCLPKERFIDYMRYGHGEGGFGYGPDGEVISPWTYHENIGEVPESYSIVRETLPDPADMEPHLVKGTD